MVNVPLVSVIGLSVNCTLAELALIVTTVELSVVTVLLYSVLRRDRDVERGPARRRRRAHCVVVNRAR